MNFMMFIVLFVLIYAKGAEGCSDATENVPVVPICQLHERFGKAVIVSSNEVPHNQEVECVCDVTVAGTQQLLVEYEGPEYLNCELQLQIENWLYSCQGGSVTTIDVSKLQEFQLHYKKTTSTANPSMCIKFTSLSTTASSVKVFCKKYDYPPVTSKPTATPKPPATTLSYSLESRHNQTQQSYTPTLNSSLSTNTTSFSISTSWLPSINTSTATSITVSSEALITSSISSSFKSSSEISDSPTTSSELFSTSEITRNLTNVSTYVSSGATMSISQSDMTTMKQLTTENTNEIALETSTSYISEPTSTENTSKATQSSGPLTSWSTTNFPITTSSNENDTKNSGTRESKDSIDLETVIIICSVLGFSLLMAITVAVTVYIYKSRNKKMKNTFNPESQQSYIDAFDSLSRIQNDDGVFLNNMMPFDNVNDPLKELYSIPHNAKENLYETTNSLGRTTEGNVYNGFPIDSKTEVLVPSKVNKSHVNRKALSQQRAARDAVINTEYDHIETRRIKPNEISLRNTEPQYDHIVRDVQESATTENDKPTDRLAALLNSSFKTNFVSERKAKDEQQDTDIYAIVRKPKPLFQQKKRPKLVTFKGFGDDEEVKQIEPRGILKNKHGEIHDGDSEHWYWRQSMNESVQIPRVKLDQDYLYSTVSQMNRSEEENVFQDQVDINNGSHSVSPSYNQDDSLDATFDYETFTWYER